MSGSYWDSKKVLVAGGAGMIGSHLVDQLVADGASVRVADNLESGSLENLAASREEIEFLQLDLRSAQACVRATSGMDVVFDVAAKTVGIAYSAKHHGEMLCHTTMISMNLLEAARQHGVRRYMVTSSSCIYPDGAPIPTPETSGEVGSPEAANEGYGWAKRFAEFQGRYFAREYDMHIVIVRPANVYGPRYNWNQSEPHVIPALIMRVLAGESPLVVWGSGRQTRSFIHAKDAARAMRLATEKGANGEAFNLGGDEYTIAQLVSAITEAAGFPGTVIYDTTKPEGPQRKALCPDKLAMATGFKPGVNFAEGLAETLKAARQHLTQGRNAAAVIGR